MIADWMINDWMITDWMIAVPHDVSPSAYEPERTPAS
jgi:hypothetical protein